MTPGDVFDAIHSDDRITRFRDAAGPEKAQSDDAMQVFFKMLGILRPGEDAKHWLPLSPLEVERLRVILRTVGDAIDVALAHRPAHFYLVAEDGR